MTQTQEQRQDEQAQENAQQQQDNPTGEAGQPGKSNQGTRQGAPALGEAMNNQQQ